MSRLSPSAAGGPNVCAFLDMLAHSEIGDALLLQTDDGYNVLVGSLPGKPLTFGSYAAHPNVLNHELNSTAAGRYQIIRGTWAGVAGELGLRDFSPENQDRAAIRLVQERGALDAVRAGEIEKAIGLCAKEWASLPGAGYGQPERKLSELLQVFKTALAKYPKESVEKQLGEPQKISILDMILSIIRSFLK